MYSRRPPLGGGDRQARGPTQRAARLDSSKVFAKEFMQRCHVPTARLKACAAAEATPDVNVFHSGTAKRESEIVTAGGRVLTVVASGSDDRSAVDRAYQAVEKIRFEGIHYRKDIGAKALS